MLVTLKDILAKAEQGKYAVGLFNMLNLEMARGIIDAAEEEKSPVILGVAEVHLPIIPFTYAKDIMTKIAREASVPVCLHFDHGTDFGKICEAMKAGFSSVMYDGSALDYEVNAANTKKITEIAHALGISVEAELGHVGEGSCEADFNCSDMYTNPDDAVRFIAETDVDALAVAIGTAHGKYIKKPQLDLDRLAKLYAAVDRPLVLHGGSGLTDEDFRNTVRGGIRKVNICTELCVAAQNAYKASDDCYSQFADAKNAVKAAAAKMMRVFESSGKAE